jgi:hypothetical protein
MGPASPPRIAFEAPNMPRIAFTVCGCSQLRGQGPGLGDDAASTLGMYGLSFSLEFLFNCNCCNDTRYNQPRATHHQPHTPTADP